MNTDRIRVLEALLFAAEGPQTTESLASRMQVTEAEIVQLLYDLEQRWSQCASAFTLQRVGGGVMMATAPDLGEVLQEMVPREPQPLSPAAWETLAVVAYRQPVTRLEIDSLRGVNSDRALATLQSRGLVDEVGRKEVPGRPILYGVTPWFLQCFGLAGCDDLPALPFSPTTGTS